MFFLRFNVRDRTLNYDPEIYEEYVIRDTPFSLPHHF